MPAETIAHVGVGSNLGDRFALLDFARAELAATPSTRVLRTSPLYFSSAVGPGTQPDYLNAVIELRTALPAAALLARLHAIESAAGRTRTERWGARTLDLDLLLYGELRCESPALSVPHPRLAGRNFVVWPLYDLVPALVLPDGTPLAQLRRALSATGVWPAAANPGARHGIA